MGKDSKPKITRKTHIADAMDINPDAAEILMEAGLGCISCAFAYAENLEDGMRAHGFTEEEIDAVIKRLNEQGAQ